MPDVTIDNPEIDITLTDGEKTSVPAGEQWVVDVFARSNRVDLRSSDDTVLIGVNSERKARVVLSAGDVIEAVGSPGGVRGWVVS